jgi:hypothetical protein
MDAHYSLEAHRRRSDNGRTLVVGGSRTIEDVCKNLSRDGHGHASES